MLHLTDLRVILDYVPRFRDRIFVIALDGAVIADDNFTNLLRDVALLRSLRIEVVIVHGAGLQVRQLAAKQGLKLTNSDGTGITDLITLNASISAANRVTQDLIVGLAGHDLQTATGNFMVCHPCGILAGIDHQYSGRVERVNTPFLRTFLDHDIIPIIPPIGFDGENHLFRLNSDAVAVEIALSLQAAKLIFLGAHPPLRQGKTQLRQLNVADTELLLKKRRQEIQPGEALSKLENGIRAIKGGVQRVHIIDGRVQEGLLAEVFSNEGIGTLIHANEYQSIRPAMKKDLRSLYNLLQRGMERDELLKRTRAEVERMINDYFVFEVDRNPIACGAVHLYLDEQKAELASLYVDDRYENQGIGIKLIHYAEDLARSAGIRELFCLSTQAINFFVHKAGFQLAHPDQLPLNRKIIYDRSGRKSQVLVKKLL